MLTILATIGLFFLIAVSYKKGKKDGINEAIDYFITEMNKKRIDIEIMNDFDILEKKRSLDIFTRIRHFIWRNNNE